MGPGRLVYGTLAGRPAATRGLVDVSLASVVVLLHVVAAVAFIAGLIGRGIVLDRARKATDIGQVDSLVAVAGPFERMVIVGSMAVFVVGLLAMWARHVPFFADGYWWLPVSLLLFLTTIPLVPLVFLPRGKEFEEALEDAREKEDVTPELRAAFADPAVAFARRYEAAAVGLILALMVLKPF
jgi:hypothetical protein